MCYIQEASIGARHVHGVRDQSLERVHIARRIEAHIGTMTNEEGSWPPDRISLHRWSQVAHGLYDVLAIVFEEHVADTEDDLIHG